MFRVSLSYYSLTFLWRLAACLKWYGVDKVQMKQQLLKCGLWRDSSDDIVHKDSLLLCACKKKRHPYPPCTDNETVAQDESVRGQWDFAQLSDCISGVTVVQLLHAPYSWSPLPSAGIKRRASGTRWKCQRIMRFWHSCMYEAIALAKWLGFVANFTHLVFGL